MDSTQSVGDCTSADQSRSTLVAPQRMTDTRRTSTTTSPRRYDSLDDSDDPDEEPQARGKTKSAMAGVPKGGPKDNKGGKNGSKNKPTEGGEGGQKTTTKAT
ncbi:hypothetical protein NLI96_g11801 [Meripilus lineatus]|uniref:Uncharacterized protein n=1 Tax=Meripilus lineatus TaxID=2056292 RepID=A0AAD5YD01_9APHY|nr:hypothetical protein NLI96_g11801 [Physisporinus lineatus]